MLKRLGTASVQLRVFISHPGEIYVWVARDPRGEALLHQRPEEACDFLRGSLRRVGCRDRRD